MAGEWITKANWEALNKRWLEMQDRIAALERDLEGARAECAVYKQGGLTVIAERDRLEGELEQMTRHKDGHAITIREITGENKALGKRVAELEMVPGFIDGLEKLSTLKRTMTERDEFKRDNRALHSRVAELQATVCSEGACEDDDGHDCRYEKSSSEHNPPL
jgi:type II secretory pathway component PulJ